VQEAIRLLGPEDAQILTHFYQGEQSLEEIGRIMGLNPNAVKVRLHRARLRLKEKMESHFRTTIREWQEG
jgi:RNA polymerase sigma-70 factor (ECF subfamily)